MSNIDPVGDGMLKSLMLFQEAIDTRPNLEIVCDEVESKSGNAVLVIEDSSIAKDVEGHQLTVDLNEIFSVIRTEKHAEDFVAVVNREANPIKLNGITRIVGYYSRTNNWNKSKIGELRDRRGENYALSGASPEHAASRDKAVNALS